MAICFGLESISSLAISNIFIDSNCLEVVKLLNDKGVDISEVSSFITETKERGGELGVVAYSHVHRRQNELAPCVARKVQIPYLELFTLGLTLTL